MHSKKLREILNFAFDLGAKSKTRVSMRDSRTIETFHEPAAADLGRVSGRGLQNPSALVGRVRTNGVLTVPLRVMASTQLTVKVLAIDGSLRIIGFRFLGFSR